MTERPTRRELGYATLAGGTGVAGSYAVAGSSPSFVIAPIDELIVNTTPGAIIAFMIENVGQPAHLLHIVPAFVVAIGLLGGASLVGLLAGDRYGRPFAGIGLAGLLGWAITAAVTGRPLLAVGSAVPLVLFTAVATRPTTVTDHDPSRRRVLTTVVGAFGTVGLGYVLGRMQGGDGLEASEDVERDEAVATRLQEAEEKSLEMAGDGLPGLVSEIGEFYNTDIASFDPTLSAEGWSMTITGEVEQDVTVSYEELTDMPTERRFETLRCVGEPLNGPKLDNAVWTGTPIKPLLEEADPGGECECVLLRAEDGYFVEFPLSALENGFLAWRMNGMSLPQSHGHPVRVLVPGHWGEVNVKWLSEIELLDEAMDGYWEQKGWQGTGPVETVAKLWSETTLDDGRIEVAGHAYAGTRGVGRVEVSIDGGGTWTDADLSEPLPGEDVWRQWRYRFEPDGTHEVVVRAIDDEGRVQPREQSDSFPSGATGWVSTTISQ